MSQQSAHFVKTGVLFAALLLGYLAVFGGAQQEPPAEPGGEAEGPKTVLYKIDGALTQTMITSLNRAWRTAKAAEAEYLIIEIDTPGGEAGLMEQLSDLVFEMYKEDNLETVAFINPAADSAGALIAISCRRLYMSPRGHIGSATPVFIPTLPIAPPQGLDIGEDMKRKIKARALAIFRAAAKEAGRNPSIAEAMVDADIELVLARIDGEETVIRRDDFFDERSRLGPARTVELDVICPKGELLNITASEAFEYGFTDGIAESRTDLLTNILGVNEADTIVVTRTWSEALVDFLQSIHWLLLIGGLVFLYVEFKIPGFGVPGIVGISLLALLFASKYMAGLAEIPEILLIVAGLGLVAAEIFFIPGTFIAGAIGVILVVVGGLLSFQPFVVPDSPWDQDLLESNIVNMGLSILAVLGIAIMITRFLPRTSLFKHLVLDTGQSPASVHASGTAIDDVHESVVKIGDEGKAFSELHPSGKIVIDGSQLDAQSEGEFIDKGDKVRVVRVVGNFIFVRKIED